MMDDDNTVSDTDEDECSNKRLKISSSEPTCRSTLIADAGVSCVQVDNVQMGESENVDIELSSMIVEDVDSQAASTCGENTVDTPNEPSLHSGPSIVEAPPHTNTNPIAQHSSNETTHTHTSVNDDKLFNEEMNVCESQSKAKSDVPMSPNTEQIETVSTLENKDFDATASDQVPNEIDSEDSKSVNEDDSKNNTKVVTDVVVGTNMIAHSSKLNEDENNIIKESAEISKVCNYHLKWFDWKGEQAPIVTQNENGPCPLLAIANVLILARKIILPKMQQLISGKQLMEYIGDCILADVPKQGGNEELLLNFEQNMQDAIDIMHKLQTGIDVNVKFSGVVDFEFTRECIVFDLLKIRLYHGWLVDPQDTVHMEVVHGLSYNQLVEKMLLSKDAEGDDVMEGMVIEEFLSRTASQLTYHGLCELNSTIQEEELCVFFRNNHFSTLYKHKGELFLLVTDQGFLTEPAVVWETLVNIEGDGQFVNSKFVSVTLQADGIRMPTTAGNLPERTMSQEDRDYLIALSLQQDNPLSTQLNKNSKDSHSVDADHKLALKLQEEENRLLQQQQHQRDIKQQKQRQPVMSMSQHDPHKQSMHRQPIYQQEQQEQLQQPQQPQQQQQQQQPQPQQPQQQQQQQQHTSTAPNTRFSQQTRSGNEGVSSMHYQSQQQQQQQQKNCTIL